MAANANLHKAKNEKNDEFYTQLTDVAAELKHYKDHFRGKIVFCNCDDPTWSAFWKYFHLNFSKLGLRKLVSTHYDRTEPTYKMEYEGGDDDNIEVGTVTPLEGNGDFRNQECLDLLDECDIVVTNPPFSLFREYVKVLMDHGKKFIIIGNMNCVTYKEIFPLIKNDELWLGMNSKAGTRKGNTMCFGVPEGAEIKNVSLGSHGERLTQVSAWWFTNLDHPKRHEKLTLWKSYSPEEYLKYDNYDAINVDKTAQIPMDYHGVMGVPISFLDKYCPEQFEIVAFRKGDDGKDLVFTREREREFNRTFASLFDSGVGSDYRCEADDLQRRKESLCSRGDTTEDMRFFAEYICSHPELIKLALADRQTDRQTDRQYLGSSGTPRTCRTALSTTVQSMDTRPMSGCSSDCAESVLQSQQCPAQCDKECRGQDCWQADVCEDLHTQETIEIFLPLSIKSRAPGTMNGLLNGKETYRRILIRRKAG